MRCVTEQFAQSLDVAALVLAADLRELRELSILRAVKSGAQSRADIERMIVTNAGRF